MSPILILSISVGAGVICLLTFATQLLSQPAESSAESRLATLTGGQSTTAAGDFDMMGNPAVTNAREAFDAWVNHHLNLQRTLDLADIAMTAGNFAMATLGISVATTAVAFLLNSPLYMLPVAFLLPPVAAKMLLSFRCKRRITKFIRQLPEALDLMGRSLRSGHSLGAGFGLIAQEMPDPISREFGRCFEEQNLGIPLEEALKNMSNRIPNMDLRFMVTSIVLQRQTGGDLVEILEKIAKLVRERFKLAGQIAALTGEGRLSGIVLFCLPPALFAFIYCTNRDYVMTLFDEPIGRYMLAFAIVSQIVGAFVIRKIIDIKV